MTNANITQSSASMASSQNLNHPPTGLPYPGFTSDATIPMVSMPAPNHNSSSLGDLPFGLLDEDPDVAKRRALERETLLSHSYRRHLFFEIGTIVACMIGGLILNILPPLKQTHNINNIAIQYPLEKQTIPEWLAAILTVFIPFVVILATKRQRGIRPAIGLLMSVGITLFITGALKNLVGELRPDFLDRCKPSPTDPQICTGDAAEIKEGRRSFPSGHSSVAAAGTVYLSLWLATRLRVFDHSHDVPKAFRLFLAHMPVCGGLAVALTRRLDHRHHWLDIIAGFLLGSYVAFLTARVYIKGFSLVTISVAGVTSARQLHDMDRAQPPRHSLGLRRLMWTAMVASILGVSTKHGLQRSSCTRKELSNGDVIR
ncbi:phosphatidic acid phosphatase type 2/haloperoxidase [Catenaria anguillulae PL171]|uniref:Phosphatidic acid phosphatase type 2/haloperoxidase n=1 Tax=Catenaria anguillulae PL171 TaxID=765915 RepID=A0A1Y2HFX9_9FUNG|nr:phosphatidic acid phosphatase type 2/haloperoxidase [Catenaria anguillulae PL171]